MFSPPINSFRLDIFVCVRFPFVFRVQQLVYFAVIYICVNCVAFRVWDDGFELVNFFFVVVVVAAAACCYLVGARTETFWCESNTIKFFEKANYNIFEKFFSSSVFYKFCCCCWPFHWLLGSVFGSHSETINVRTNVRYMCVCFLGFVLCARKHWYDFNISRNMN